MKDNDAWEITTIVPAHKDNERDIRMACIRGSVPDQNFHRFYEFFLHTGIRIVFEKLPIIVNGIRTSSRPPLEQSSR